MFTSVRSTILALTFLIVLNGASFANVHLRNTEEKLLQELLENAETEKEIFSFASEKEIYVYDYAGKLILSGHTNSDLKLPHDLKVLIDTEDAIIYIAD